MSYGVALRNGIPFTLGTIAALCVNATSQWSPLALWPNGVDSPGMWSSPSTLPASFNDYTGTTPVATPGTVADSTNPVGLALDIRAGATVLTDPGNHMLQATAAARPLESARVNLLTYTEDFSNAVWQKRGAVSVTPNAIIAPDGTLTADLVSGIGAAGVDDFFQVCVAMPAATGALTDLSFYIEKVTSSGTLGVSAAQGPGYGYWTVALSSVGSGWARITSEHPAVTVIQPFVVPLAALNAGPQFYAAAGGPLSMYIWGAQLALSEAVVPYQSVPGDGSTYTSTGVTPWQLYDGVDDGMATASFAAGTLINGMDCMIPVRRDSAVLPVVAGLYQADQTKFFGVVAYNSGDGASTYGGCGTPSIFVDGASVTNTRGALFDALGVGEFHILEYRDLDLSTWVDAAWGGYPTYLHNGARGDIMLYPSTASTTDKDAARQYLADKYGVTLP